MSLSDPPCASVVLPLTYADPANLFAPLAGEAGAMLLDGGASEPERGRYSYIVSEPDAWLEAVGDQVRLNDQPVTGTGITGPFAWLRTLLPAERRSTLPDLPPFQGGLVGLIGYEAGGWLERLPTPCPADLSLPDMAFGRYQTLAAFDHRRQQAWIIAPDQIRADRLRHRLSGPSPAPASSSLLLTAEGWHAELSPEEYRVRVRQILDWIKAGDIYQANMTQRFLGQLADGITPWQAYLALRPRTAGPFSAFLNLGAGRALASGSPERFLALTADGRMESRPIKGTVRRGVTEAEDVALAAALLASEKDRAENLMIVDLLRNDLSRVAKIGSVRVPTLFGLESYRAVHHLVSVVQGRLRAGLGPVDLLQAAFPGGSITGAPKIRAMEIIAALEPARRGPYCGSVVWIGDDGAMDSSIIIRSLCVAGRRVVAQAGGGIVADSDPDAEYQESLLKARALLTALDGRFTGFSPAATQGVGG
jgi:para-aminobenzoate synthetase component I